MKCCEATNISPSYSRTSKVPSKTGRKCSDVEV